MLYMVIERFQSGSVREVYRRVDERGRMIPDGLEYLNSWVSADLAVCYQLMETDDIALLQQWTAEWSDLVDFQIVPVLTSVQAAEFVKGLPPFK